MLRRRHSGMHCLHDGSGHMLRRVRLARPSRRMRRTSSARRWANGFSAALTSRIDCSREPVATGLGLTVHAYRPSGSSSCRSDSV